MATAADKVWLIYKNTTEEEVRGEQNKSRSTNRNAQLTFSMWVNQSDASGGGLSVAPGFRIYQVQVYQVCPVDLGERPLDNYI